MKHFTLLFLSLFLVACQLPLIKDKESYLQPSSNAMLEITEELEISPHYSRVFLQSGNTIPPFRLNYYVANCEIEVNTLSDVKTYIAPEIFHITSISQQESPIVMTDTIKVASLNDMLLKQASSSFEIKRFFRFHLSPQNSQSQSQVTSLLCRGIQDEHVYAELPTLEEINSAVGQYIKFTW
ncbi:MAG: hypothetical protein KAI02_06085 [Gammaproteobacteria bacterium]|nr:hypothetical protein [Gammaproteobacteria bacterium]